jgi:hypothetical protein|tara:strand:+ start:8308 stop:8469 length:162 start_codon:yes stop_codon:yes gene_type:complete
MSNIIDFQAVRNKRSNTPPKYISIGNVEATFDVVYDIDYDKFYNLFKIKEQYE